MRDPVVELQQIRDENRRWQGRFVAACAAFAFLLFVSVLQFVGTFITCNILFAARRDTERAHKETLNVLKELRDAHSTLDRASNNLQDARRTIAQAGEIDETVQRLQTQTARLLAREETEGQHLRAMQRHQAMRTVQEQQLRDAEIMLARLHKMIAEYVEQAELLPPPKGAQAPANPLIDLVARIPPAPDGTTKDPVISFEKNVLPIFEVKCARCHINARKGKLSLASLRDVARGGQSGSAIAPGHPEKSLIWQAISDREMPPKGEPALTAAEKETIRIWITVQE
ncbi:hypothetical protein AYO44_08165 [Planctomycetaceae bacterium SCGC AG-212-F19]|nr:hypothetical protein AYO44_08165 [Planctomycetaceae bacterium SCGC AG-212-F19]